MSSQVLDQVLYPIECIPLPMARVWGGNILAAAYQKPWSLSQPIGESWEITDRPEGVSPIANGLFAGRDLRWLLQHHPTAVLGHSRPAADGRFPLLVKLLDARETLSLQVHPPAAVAPELGGEPKTEVWHVLEADPDSYVYAGFKPGTTPEGFRRALASGRAADCVHRIPVRRGDFVYVPSGRIHALGAGLVVLEIQQNSDTTYRVSDWNRVGLDGKPRELHVEQSIRCIDFTDIAPGLAGGQFVTHEGLEQRVITSNEAFELVHYRMAKPGSINLEFNERPGVMCVISGNLEVLHGPTRLALDRGRCALLPAALGSVRLGNSSSTGLEFLVAIPR